MGRYRQLAMKELATQQVRFANPERKIEQLDRAERLLGELKDGQRYPYQYVCFRITEFRPETYESLVMSADDLRHDLTQFIESLSASITFDRSQVSSPILTVEDVTARFNVSAKTVSRWRDRGLIARRFMIDGRRRIGFLESTVKQFVSLHAETVNRGSKFSQMSDQERERILAWARRLAKVPTASLQEITRRLARKFDRSIEAIRYTIRHHDQEFPNQAIFPDSKRPLDEAMRGAMFAAYRRGESLASIADRFQRTRSSVHRIINDVRAERVLNEPIEFMFHATFEKPSADKIILETPPPKAGTSAAARAPAGLPPYLQSLYEVPLLSKEQEQYYFRKMNYLLYKAANLQKGMATGRVRANDLDQIDAYLKEATEIKRLITRSNLRLVVSIAKRHVGATGNLFELISDGNISLMRAVEKFDFGRGFKFSTYASWAIMKNFARSIPQENKHKDRFLTGQDLAFEFAPDIRSDLIEREVESERTHQEVIRFLNRLDDREREIIERRFGLQDHAEPQTLEQVGQRLGVTKERIRQIEVRAISKLRQFASEAQEEVGVPATR